MKRKVLSLLLTSVLAVSSLAFVGCGNSSTEGEGGTTDANLPNIGVTIYKYDDNFMSFVRQAITAAAEGNAIVNMNDSQNDQAKQIEQIDTLISKGVKALAVNLVDPKSAPTVIEKAKQADIPVVFFNKEPEAGAMDEYDKAWYVGTDSSESGVLQGELIAEQWEKNKDAWDKNKDGKIQYVLIKGEPGHPDAEARTKYSVQTITEKGIEVEELAMDAAMWDTAKATEKMDAWISKFGDGIELIISNNDSMALGALASIQKEGYNNGGDKYIPLVGVDAIPEALTKIEAGEMLGSILNDAKNQGLATVQVAVNAANGNDPLEGTEWKLDDKKAVRVPYVKITKDNITVAQDAYK
ncbi:galactose/glucose ABC transporter substrate-binding protein MglB [Clostridium sp.]|uniref:galactose/glucose ABC transporter substrate-binding protein MglB n=1 Tax=Clostridium sp. TaxID=1506 RepID=UPI003F3884BB